MINLKNIAIEFLNLIENNGYKAYIVGGFVRDYLLGIETTDIDITTNATPKDIQKIFSDVKIKREKDDSSYGSIIVAYKNIEFQVTTFRKEYEYLDNRHPSKIEYVNDLYTDLLRRDFTINTICMDKNSQIIDLLNGQEDLKNKTIKTISNSVKSFSDDSLRILRAIRFSATLNFSMDDELIEAIEKCKKYLKNISYERKKIELDKIFISKYAKKGIELIKKYKLENSLELSNLDKILDFSDVIGIWSMINSSCYKFSKHEKYLIKKVREVYELNKLDSYTLYKYGLYVSVLALGNRGISKRKITEMYNNLPIKSKNDIDISAMEICNLLNKKPDVFLNNIYSKLEQLILDNKLNNNKEEILNFLTENYLK